MFFDVCTYCLIFFLLLLPASEGWGKVIFSVCSHLRGEGYPVQVWMVGVYPISGLGGVPCLGLDDAGYPISGLG